METISMAEKHAQGLSSQIDELKMEKAASENQIAWLKSDVNNTWSSDEQSASRAQKKVKELLQKLKGLHSGGSNSKQGQVREISEKLNTEFSLRQAEKRRTFELT